MDTRTRIILAAELATQGLSISAIACQLDRHRETIGLWLKAIRIDGVPAFLDRYSAAKTGPRRARTAMTRRFTGPVQISQTDGGPEFTGAFALLVHQYCTRDRVARPYKKNEQAYSESFNRTLRKDCLGWASYRIEELPALQNEVRAFLNRYHDHRSHLGFTPMRPPLAPSGLGQDGLSDIYGE